MRRRLALAAVAAAVLATPIAAGAAENPFAPFRQFFREPAKTIKRVMQTPPGSTRAKAAPAAETPAAAPGPAETAPAVATADVPLPRLRPAGGPDQPGSDAMSFAAEAEAVVAPAFPPVVAPAAPADEMSLAERAAIPPDRTPGDIAVVLPHPRPRIAAVVPPGLGKLKPSGPVLAALPPGGVATLAACKRSLAALGIEAAPLAPIREGACGVAAPTAVASLDGGAIPFSTKAIVNCAVAGALAGWMDEDVQPAAKRYLGGRVTGLRVAASYVCRGRNNLSGAQLSEHAFGNAIDISALKVEGVGWVEVGNTRTPAQAAFLRAIRKDACGPFTTVLGPGVAYHDTHFHLDLARRRTSGPSKGRYCK